MTDPVSKLLDDIEKLKSDIKLKTVTTNELFVQHIEERQETKKDFFVRRRLLEQKHEEEVVRIESDILRLKVEMDQLERQLSGLVNKSDSGGQEGSPRHLKVREDLVSPGSPPSLNLPCPNCPVCRETMRPPVEIYQCSNGHLVCQHCHANLHVTNCRST